MRRAAVPALLVAAVCAAVGAACRDDVASPKATGSISLQIVLSDLLATDLADRVPASSSGFTLFGHLEAARAHARGPTNRTVNLTQSTSGDAFTGSIAGLQEGSYTVIVEGLVGGEVDYYGETQGVAVTAGQNSNASITFASFRPPIITLPERTASRAFEVCIQGVNGADSYRIEWAQSPDFSGLSSTTATGTCAPIEVGDYGKHYVRARAVNPAVASGRPGDPDSVEVVAAAVAAAGTVMEASETEIRQGGATLLLTLTDDTWLPEVGEDNPVTQALLDGIDSEGVEVRGWDAVVKAGLSFNDLSRISDTEVQITLPPFPAYDISAPETVTPTVPPVALTQSVDPLPAPTSFQIVAIPGSAQLAGTATDDTELEIRAGGSNLVITLIDDSWVPEVGGDNAITRALLDGLVSDGAEAAGWNAVVVPGLAAANVQRVSGAEVIIQLPAFPGYDITAPEQITATVPAGALAQSQTPFTASPSFNIATAPGLAVQVTGNGTVTSQPGGIGCPGDCGEDFGEGTTVTLTAAPDAFWVFSGWGGACTGVAEPVCQVQMSGPQNVSATFVRDNYALNVLTVTGNGSVTSDPAGIACPGDCTEVYVSETPVTLTATADPLWHFSAWGGACSGTTEPVCDVVMTQMQDVSATFVRDTFPLGVQVVGTGNVSSAPAGIDCPGDCTENYPSEELVALTATAAPLWHLSTWGGACTGAVGTLCEVVMTQAQDVAATFVPDTFLLTTTVTGFGTLTSNPPGINCGLDCSEPFPSDVLVMISQQPDFGWTFAGWGGACVGTGLCEFSMTQDTSVSGTFAGPRWIDLKPAGTPPVGRARHSAIHIEETDQMVVFGGAVGDGVKTNDVWVLNNATGAAGVPSWQLVVPGGDPPPLPRDGHSAVYDPASDRMIVFGGSADGEQFFFSDVWALEGLISGKPVWIPLLPDGPMIPRHGHTAIYNPGTNQMIVFGGQVDDAGRSVTEEVWVLSDANGTGGNPTWRPIAPTNLPRPRMDATAVYDPNTDLMIMFGGADPNNGIRYDDVWHFVLGDGTGEPWKLIETLGEPPSPRSGHSAVYRPETNRMTVYGPGGEIWVLLDVDAQVQPEWRPLIPEDPQAPVRDSHTAIYDLRSNLMVVFGGLVGGLPANDVWALTRPNGEAQ